MKRPPNPSAPLPAPARPAAGLRLAMALVLVLAPAWARSAAGLVRRGAAPAGPSGGLGGIESRTAAVYQAAYCYALACLAGMGGDAKDQADLLAKAQEADPDSELLARERAGVLAGEGLPREASAVLAAALARHPSDMDLRRGLAGLYNRAGDGARARALFLKKGGADPDDPGSLRALIALDIEDQDYASAERRLRSLMPKGGTLDDRELLALSLQRRRRWRDAEAEYRAVLAADPSRDASWGQLASCEEADGDTPAAKAALLAGLKAVAKSPLLADQLARLLYADKDYAGAASAFGRLAAMDPTDGHALFYRGLSRLKLGRYRQAEQDFRGLGKLEGGDVDQANALALALLLQKKYAAAARQLERVVALQPWAEEAWAELAYVDERGGRSAAAVKDLVRGVRALPASKELVQLLAQAQEDSGDLGGAAATLRKALIRAEDGDTRFQLATVLDKQGKYRESEKQLELVLAESPRDAEALNYLGYSWVERGEKLPQAEALIRRALAVEPGNPYYLDSLGWDLHLQGRDAAALRDLLQASRPLTASADAEEAIVFDHLARVEQGLGRLKEARAARAQAAKIRGRARPGKAASADSGAHGNRGL